LFKIVHAIDRHAVPNARGGLDVKASFTKNLVASSYTADGTPAEQSEERDIYFDPVHRPVNAVQAGFYGTLFCGGALCRALASPFRRAKSNLPSD
jgi:hypothetical protein